MDFQKLLKQAASNQVSKQKELESKKKELESEKKLAKLQEIEKKREAKKKLGRYEEETIKSRLIYHGLASSSGVPIKNIATPSASTASKTTPSAKVNNDPRHSQATRSKQLPSKGSKSKSLSPMPPPPTNASIKKPATSKASSSSSNKVVSKSKTPPPGKLKSSGMPTDFQELLKLAQKNSVSTFSNSGNAINQKRESGLVQKNTAPSIGVGKSLINRDKSAQPSSSTKVHVHVNGDSQRTKEKEKSNSSECKTNSAMVISKGKSAVKDSLPPKNDRPQLNPTANCVPQTEERTYPYPRPYPRPYPKVIHKSPGQQTSENSTSNAMKQQKKGPPGTETKKQITGQHQIHATIGGRGSTLSKDRIAKTANPNKFYSASARLITDGSYGGSSRVPMLGYRSTWADEMTEYLRNNQYELEEDDEEEFDDFVVDEVEDEWGGEGIEDYSSAIKSIFGDKYCSATSNDEVMESSFAQQQYEEMRSARIGRLEDEEDIKRERELDRKRKLKANSNSSKKSKH